MRKLAFTMAEILLSLTIIGVVAAITLPSLMGNVNERTWNTQRKALLARMSQAIAMMPYLNGYGETSASVDNAAQTFLTNGLSKSLKINNICDSEHLSDCGLSSTVYKMDGSVAYTSLPKTTLQYNYNWIGDETVPALGVGIKNAAFETQNGESVLLMYNPDCGIKDGYRRLVDINVCANFVYDLNGNKGPNMLGKDVGFMTAFYAINPVVVAPMPAAANANSFNVDNLSKMNTLCAEKFGESRAANIDEAMSLAINEPLIGYIDAVGSITLASTDNYYYVQSFAPQYGVQVDRAENAYAVPYCLKR